LNVIKGEGGLRTHLELIEAMGTRAISSDESDFSQNPEVFWRVSPPWRSTDLELFLYRLDEISILKRSTNIGTRRRPGGRPGRQRCFSDKVNNAMAPPGLPRNCYSSSWVESLRPIQRGMLDQQEWDYDFLIPEDLSVDGGGGDDGDDSDGDRGETDAHNVNADTSDEIIVYGRS
jgi:hypothetical protein